MRLYTFINYYLSSIQQGIQTGHILGEIVNNTRAEDALSFKATMVREFLDKHKTFVVCNGGNHADIREIVKLFGSLPNPYPWACFYEDGDSLNNLMTGVGIILPEEIYDFNVEFKFNSITKQREKIYTKQTESWPVILDNPETFQYKLVDAIKSAPLAR